MKKHTIPLLFIIAIVASISTLMLSSFRPTPTQYTSDIISVQYDGCTYLYLERSTKGGLEHHAACTNSKH